ncbi:MAG: hypothetical protein JST89_02150 [Cyanobacteria bacterium SZAS-4]|nr:hypothetical protein [Cyanobacteria bacterium SZAS-4]
MDVLNFGSIKSVVLPNDWLADSEQNTGVMKMRCFHPRAHDDVEIAFFQKMQGVLESAIKDFREILACGPHKIVEGGTELIQLSPVMGNAGNHQWSNKTRGPRGPNFRYTLGEIIDLQGRKVLRVKGSFVEPESKKPQNEYCGIFIDSGSENNLVQEVYLQVPSKYGYFQFEKYVDAFSETLSTIVWT